nr:retrovirus-related Pol polyprotein from transposon TNT 1-94 [Tanacetum cinerariifolium]
MNDNENLFVPASMWYDQEMVPKTKDWVERLNSVSKLPNFNTGRILVLESQVVNKSRKSTETLNTLESSKDSKAESLTPLPPLKNLQGASPSSEILKAKAKPFSLRTHYGFNDHRPDDCRNYPKCEICRSYDRFTLRHNRVIHIRGGMLVDSSQSSESSIGVKMVEYQNDVNVKQIKTNNGIEFRNHEFESFCGEKGISWNFSSPYIPEQNGVVERKNKTLIEAARTIHDKTPYEISRERIPDISYFHVFGCLLFIHNHKDHLSKFDAKANDGYFLGYSFVSKAFRVFNTKRQQVEDHVTFDESMEANRFTNTSIDKIGIDDSSRYHADEFLQEDDPSRQYQVDFNVSYYSILHGRSLTELTQENQVPEVFALNEPDIPHTEDTKSPPGLINT